MTTGTDKRDAAKKRLAQLLGLEDPVELNEKYIDLFNVLSLPGLDIVLDIAESVAKIVGDDVAVVNGNGPQKMQAIYEAARNAKGKLAETIMAIIESNDFEDDNEPFISVMEETDAGVS